MERVVNELVEDAELSFKLFEFTIRTMCYAELERFDVELFGQDLQLNLEKENVAYPAGEFTSSENVIRVSQMAVSTAFGATAICLDCILENSQSNSTDITILKSLISAVRNAFSHGIAAPKWYIKPHKYEILDLAFVGGPRIDLEILNGQRFEYSQIGGLAVWNRVKEYVVSNT